MKIIPSICGVTDQASVRVYTVPYRPKLYRHCSTQNYCIYVQYLQCPEILTCHLTCIVHGAVVIDIGTLTKAIQCYLFLQCSMWRYTRRPSNIGLKVICLFYTIKLLKLPALITVQCYRVTVVLPNSVTQGYKVTLY